MMDRQNHLKWLFNKCRQFLNKYSKKSSLSTGRQNYPMLVHSPGDTLFQPTKNYYDSANFLWKRGLMTLDQNTELAEKTMDRHFAQISSSAVETSPIAARAAIHTLEHQQGLPLHT